MAGRYFYQQIKKIGWAHLPAVMLLLGYGVYWLELYVMPWNAGVTTLFAWGLFAALCFIKGCVARNSEGKITQAVHAFAGQSRCDRAMILCGVLLVAVMAAVIFYASLLPPHFPQEGDALRYHLSLPRQHLIIGSFFQHLSWHWADLSLIPLDYALAPYCLIGEMPNKLAHGIVVLGLLGVTANLTRRFSGGRWLAVVLSVFAVLGSHGLGIQFGTAMIDLMIGYLFLAALDSLLSGNMFLGMMEFALFFWSKAFIPVQTLLILLIMAGLYVGIRKTPHTICWSLACTDDQVSCNISARLVVVYGAVFLIFSVLIAGPFLAKSQYYAGTPLYPFGTGLVSPSGVSLESDEWAKILQTSRDLMKFKDSYGHGRSVGDFIKHFFLIAVPEKGVNNAYDYPVGLPYLLCLVPFCVYTWGKVRQRQYPLLALYVVLFWATWWIGSQQARFLYIPIILLMLLVCARRQSGSVFLGALVVSLMLNVVSTVKNHRVDWFRTRQDVITAADRSTLAMNREYLLAGRMDVVVVRHPYTAFARFPVCYIKEK